MSNMLLERIVLQISSRKIFCDCARFHSNKLTTYCVRLSEYVTWDTAALQGRAGTWAAWADAGWFGRHWLDSVLSSQRRRVINKVTEQHFYLPPCIRLLGVRGSLSFAEESEACLTIPNQYWIMKIFTSNTSSITKDERNVVKEN